MSRFKVLDQVGPPGEGAPAESTCVRSLPTVDPQVSLQTFFPAEVSAAGGAAVRFLPGVNSPVDLHPPDGAALPAADVAGAAQLLVGPQVVSEALGRVQLVPAGAAPAPGLLPVRLGVPDQNPLRVEGGPADPAPEGLDWTHTGGVGSAAAAGHLVLALRRAASDVFPQSPLRAEVSAAAAAGKRPRPPRPL